MTSESQDSRFGLDALKAKFDSLEHALPVNAAARARRAISWLERANLETEDADAAFVFLWIAFSAVCPDLSLGARPRQDDVERFFERALAADESGAIRGALANGLFDTTLKLVANPYVFEPFWDYYGSDSTSADEWQDTLIESVESVSVHIENGEIHKALATLFERLLVVSRQTLGGEATWMRYVNRSQMENGAEIMSFLVPALIRLTLDNPDMLDRTPRYPSVESDTHEIVEDVGDYALAVNVIRRVDIGQERVYSSEEVEKDLDLDD